MSCTFNLSSASAVKAVTAADVQKMAKRLLDFEKMVVLARGDTLAVEDVPANIRDEARLNGVSGVSAAPAPAPAVDFALTESLAEVEKRKILAALDAAGGNRSKAAIALGISRRTLHRKLNEWKHDGA